MRGLGSLFGIPQPSYEGLGSFGPQRQPLGLALPPGTKLDREMSYDGTHPRQQEQAARDHFRSYGPELLKDAFIPGYGAGGDAKAASEAYGEGRYGAAAGNALLAAADFVPGLGALAAIPGAARKGIRAYHGSPHDFDRFNMSKIGTGEGSQAYGHGLYFAENEGVARSYRDALGFDELTIDGKTYQMLGRGPATMNYEVKKALGVGDIDADELFDALSDARFSGTNPVDEFDQRAAARVKELENDIAGATGENYRRGTIRFLGEEKQRLARLRQVLVEKGVTPFRKTGKMYEVNIDADPEAFLDWDKPLSEQPGAFREYVGERGYPEQRLQDTMTNLDLREGRINLSGFSPERTKDLRDAGIPGIKYLDAGSRGAGDGSRNYVVFDDRLITILRKYGIGGLIAGGGAYALTDAEYAQAGELLAQDGINTGAQ